MPNKQNNDKKVVATTVLIVAQDRVETLASDPLGETLNEGLENQVRHFQNKSSNVVCTDGLGELKSERRVAVLEKARDAESIVDDTR